MTQNVFEEFLPKQLWIPSDGSYCTTNQGSYEYIIRAILSFFQSTNLYRMNKTLPQNQIYNM